LWAVAALRGGHDDREGLLAVPGRVSHGLQRGEQPLPGAVPLQAAEQRESYPSNHDVSQITAS
jgi:hypothetical protein